jgi:hypothetical protein
VDDLVAKKGDEASSIQALSEENQAKLREILFLLQRDIQDQVRDVDLLEEVLESINQELLTISKPLGAYLSTGQSLCSNEESLEEPILPTSPRTKES